MEKYLAIIMLAAPGFIAKSVAKLLGDSPPKRGELESVMVYFTYSIFALFLTVIFASWSWIGLIPPGATWAGIEKLFESPSFLIKFFCVSLICSVLVGAAWQLVLEKRIVKGFNWINKKLGGNEIFLNGSLFDRLFVDDKKDHFLVVEKDGKIVTMGFLRSWNSPDSDRLEFFVAERPAYREWMNYVKATGIEHPLKKILGVYLDVTNNTIIREHEFPQEWLTTSPGRPPGQVNPDCLAEEL
ncbi:MAG: hypothetical protein RIN56_00100 [Sporomusaceae bacterium]|nr:hypothetical protein [Sporomusaceae bacterium]